MAKELKLEWYVYYYSHTSGKFKVFNVFRHGSYIAYVEKWLKADLTKEEFAEKLRRESMYYYWSKSEWEVIVTDTTPHISEKELQRVLKEYYLDRKVGENKPRYGRVNLADCEILCCRVRNHHSAHTCVWRHRSVWRECNACIAKMKDGIDDEDDALVG